MFKALVETSMSRTLKLAPLAIALAFTFASPASAQTTKPLSGDDYAEILQLYFKYPIALDNRDAEGYANLFTDDGVFNTNVGRKALIEFVSSRPKVSLRHAPLTPMITATPEGASGAVMNLFVDAATTPPAITRVIQYTDTLVKTPQGWRFKKRTTGTADVAAPAAAPN
jgi:hypothetical protein